jgi:hypothetical protein
MLTARNIYIAIMVLAGLVLGLASLQLSVIHDGPVPPLMYLIGVSFLIDLPLMNLAAKGRLEPLPIEARFIGVIAAALIYLGLRATLAA